MATIAALMVDVAANTANIDRSTRQINTQLDSIGQGAKRMAELVGLSFGLGAIVSFGSQVLEAADAVQKMADQTSLTTDEVQRLQYISGQSGSSIESLVSANQDLQKHLGQGDSGTIGAIKKFHINMDAFLKLGAYQQMTTLADSVREIKNPTDQAAAAAALFGKNWKEILPAIKSGMKELGDEAPNMADRTIKALDRIGDAVDRLKRWSVTFAGEFVAQFEAAAFAAGDFLSRLDPAHLGMSNTELLKLQGMLNDPDGVKGALQQTAKAASEFTRAGMEPLAKIVAPTGAALADLNRQLDINREAMNADTIAARKVADALLEAHEARVLAFGASSVSAASGIGPAVDATLLDLKRFRDALRGDYDPRTALVGGWSETSAAIMRTTELIDDLTLAMQRAKDVEASIAARGASGIEQIGQQLVSTTQHTRSFGQNLRGAFDGAASILDNIGGKWAEFGAIVARTGSAVMSNLAQGNVFGAVVAGVTGAVSAIGKVFSSAEKKVNPVRQAFIDAGGGLAIMNQRAAEAGVTMREVLDARTPEQYTAAINRLNDALQFQKDAMATLDETTKRYGFTLDELGPALQRQELDKQAQQLFKDFSVLTAAGLDVDVVLSRMGDSVNTFVQDALRTGTEIPAAMEPMLQRMVEMGTLTDASGTVITDLGGAGVRFAMTMSDGFRAIVDEVKKLTDAISRGLGLAIQNIPQPEVVGRVHWNVDDIPRMDPGPGGGYDIPELADGGVVTKPTLAWIGEGGSAEAVIPLDRAGVVAQGDGGGNWTELRAEMSRMREQMEQQASYFNGQFARDLARAVRDKRQLALAGSR